MTDTHPPASVVALLDVSPPHGGQLVNRMMRGQMRNAVQERAGELYKVNLKPFNLSDLELLANGAMSPLTGFMGQSDYERSTLSLARTLGLDTPSVQFNERFDDG